MATLPGPGQPISILQIAEEYGGAAPHSLSEYRGKGNSSATGPVSFSDFAGTSTAISVYAPSVSKQQASGPYSGSSTASVTGGDGTHSITWTRISGAAVHTGSTTSATIQFASAVATGQSVYRVTANDGQTSDSHDITVNFEDLA